MEPGVVENLAQQARGRGGGRSGGRGDLASGGELAAIGKGGRRENTYGIGGIKGAGQGSLGGKLDVRVDISSGKESSEGVINKEAIRKTVKRKVKELRGCYEKLAQRDLNAQGRVDLNWTIEANGRVGSVRVIKSQIKDQSTLDCMKSRLAKWRFPDPLKGVIGDINYPFVFSVIPKEDNQDHKVSHAGVTSRKPLNLRFLRVHQNDFYQFTITCSHDFKDCGERTKCINYMSGPSCRLYDKNQNIAMNLTCDSFGDCKKK